jgi:hypothetical protein
MRPFLQGLCAALLTLAGGLGGSACQSGSPPRSRAYAEDVKRICNAQAMSGALEQDPAVQPVWIARWLGANIATQQGRDLLARQAGLQPKEKVALLRREARASGLDGCPTAELWTK